MKKIYVYSTLSSDMRYTNFAAGGADLPVEAGSVLIRGGAGVANDRLVTPRGVVTEIGEAELEVLRGNKVFELHEKNGFIVVSEASTDPEKVAADMVGRDQSAPLVPQDGVAGDATVVVGGVEVDGESDRPSSRKGRK
jgi:hypothetical protein